MVDCLAGCDFLGSTGVSRLFCELLFHILLSQLLVATVKVFLLKRIKNNCQPVTVFVVFFLLFCFPALLYLWLCQRSCVSNKLGFSNYFSFINVTQKSTCSQYLPYHLFVSVFE